MWFGQKYLTQLPHLMNLIEGAWFRKTPKLTPKVIKTQIKKKKNILLQIDVLCCNMDFYNTVIIN